MQNSQQTESDPHRRGQAIMRGWLIGVGVVWIVIIAVIWVGIAWANRSGTVITSGNNGSTIVVSKQSISVTGDGSSETLSSNGSEVTVTGDNNTVTLHGDCSAVTVSGENNMVQAAQVDSVTATRDGNRISWTGSAAPSVINNGTGNHIGPSAL